MKSINIMILGLLVSGCAGTAILPAKITYTYPLADALVCYPPAGMGAVAKQDNGTLRLYLPLLKQQLRPKTIVFQSHDPQGILWDGEDDPALKARFIQQAEQEDCAGMAGKKTDLFPGMLVVEFPPTPDDYAGLAGKRIWLSATAADGEIFVVRGIYWKSQADLADRVK